MNFLLIYPPVDSFYIDTKRQFYGLSPPLGLLSIAESLQKIGNNVKVIDYSSEPFREYDFVENLTNIDIVGISVLSLSVEKVKKIINLIRKNRPKIKIVIGGPHCTMFPEKSIEETDADISVQGDGENVVCEINKAYSGKLKLSEISGIFYEENGLIKSGRKIKLLKNIDSFTFPARNLVKKYAYGKVYDPSIKRGEFTSIVTSRGCPFHCRFCSRNSISMKNYRIRSVENVIKELKEIYEMGYRYVAFNDDCFLSNKKNAKKLFEKIIEEEIGLSFYITAARVDSADEDLYKILKIAGVKFIQFGLESGNQDILDFYRKKTTLDDMVYAVNLANETGFFTTGSFIIGAPFETKKHIKNTIEFAKSLPLDSVSFLPLRYMAGSELWIDAVKNGLITNSEYIVDADSERRLAIFSKTEIYDFCKKAQRSFYIRPSFFIHLLKSSLKKSDPSFFNSYLAYLFDRK